MSTLTVNVPDQTSNSLQELAAPSGMTMQELVSDALDKYLAIREFYSLRSRVIQSSGLKDLPSDEEIFEIVS